MSKPGTCHQLSFATNPILSNFIGKLNFFIQSLDLTCHVTYRFYDHVTVIIKFTCLFLDLTDCLIYCYLNISS